jgi:hypothetical protein
MTITTTQSHRGDDSIPRTSLRHPQAFPSGSGIPLKPPHVGVLEALLDDSAFGHIHPKGRGEEGLSDPHPLGMPIGKDIGGTAHVDAAVRCRHDIAHFWASSPCLHDRYEIGGGLELR